MGRLPEDVRTSCSPCTTELSFLPGPQRSVARVVKDPWSQEGSPSQQGGFRTTLRLLLLNTEGSTEKIKVQRVAPMVPRNSAEKQESTGGRELAGRVDRRTKRSLQGSLEPPPHTPSPPHTHRVSLLCKGPVLQSPATNSPLQPCLG